MAVKAMIQRQVTWICKSCGATNISGATQMATNKTTKSAEEHADHEAHNVIAIGTIMYAIGPGSTAEDDPFS